MTTITTTTTTTPAVEAMKSAFVALRGDVVEAKRAERTAIRSRVSAGVAFLAVLEEAPGMAFNAIHAKYLVGITSRATAYRAVADALLARCMGASEIEASASSLAQAIGTGLDKSREDDRQLVADCILCSDMATARDIVAKYRPPADADKAFRQLLAKLAKMDLTPEQEEALRDAIS